MGVSGDLRLGKSDSVFCVDAVYLEALRFIAEERFVDAPIEPAVEIAGVVGTDDEEVFGCGNTVGVVVDHGLVSVEGQAVVHIAFDGVGRDELVVRSDLLDLTSLLKGIAPSLLKQSNILQHGLTVTNLGADPNHHGYFLTDISVTGPGGHASVTLETTSKIGTGSMPDSLYKALVLPGH